MNKDMQQKLPQIIIGVVVLAGLGYFIFHKGPAAQYQAPAGNPPAGEAAPAGNPPASSTAPGPAPKAAVQKSAPKPVSSLSVLTPAAGDSWAISHTHDIAWTKGAGFTGSIELVNASTNDIVGVISANTAAAQDFYPWDARDLFLSRVSSSKTSLQPGNYKIEIVFDGKLAPIESGIFSVVAESGPDAVTPLSRIQNKKITPNNIAVSRGTKIIFANNDSVAHQIYGNGIASFSIYPGYASSFDTAALPAGIYTLYSNVYTYLSPVTLTVR